MSRNNNQFVFLSFVIILLCGCSTGEERTCEICETFFSENDHYPYPKRKHTTIYSSAKEMIINGNGNSIFKIDSIPNLNEDQISQDRLLTPKEYENLQNLMFCFIGKDYEMVLSYFKDFYITTSIYHNDLPDVQVDYLDLIVCTKKYKSKDTFRCRDDRYKRIDLWHTNVTGRYIFLGSKSDSLNLKNCLED